METPLWEQAKAAIDAGDPDGAKALIDRAVTQWAGLKDYSINWITSLLTFIADELGEEAVERALRKTGDEFVRPRRNTGTAWGDLPASRSGPRSSRGRCSGTWARSRCPRTTRRSCSSFRCGSGGKLIDDGRVRGRAPVRGRCASRPAGRSRATSCWVYCAHCSVNNEIQPVEWGEAPTSIEFPPERPGEPCVHHVYKDVGAIPAEAYERIGKPPPSR